MRVSHPIAALPLLAAGLLGCGGSGKPTLVDAAPDTPFACAQRGTVSTTTPLNFSQGGQAPGEVPMGGTQLTVSVIVTTTGASDRGFFLVQVNNGGVYSAAAGKAGRFETPPAPGTYPMDPDMNVGFAIDFVNGITTSGTTARADATQIALLDPTAPGTVRIDSFTPAAAPGGTSTIAATITNAKFKGFNVLPGGAIDQTGNGCDITVQNLQFTGLGVKWQTGAFPTAVAPPAAVAPDRIAPPVTAPVIDGVTALSADFRVE